MAPHTAKSRMPLLAGLILAVLVALGLAFGMPGCGGPPL